MPAISFFDVIFAKFWNCGCDLSVIQAIESANSALLQKNGFYFVLMF